MDRPSLGFSLCGTHVILSDIILNDHSKKTMDRKVLMMIKGS